MHGNIAKGSIIYGSASSTIYTVGTVGGGYKYVFGSFVMIIQIELKIAIRIGSA